MNAINFEMASDQDSFVLILDFKLRATLCEIAIKEPSFRDINILIQQAFAR